MLITAESHCRRHRDPRARQRPPCFSGTTSTSVAEVDLPRRRLGALERHIDAAALLAELEWVAATPHAAGPVLGRRHADGPRGAHPAPLSRAPAAGVAAARRHGGEGRSSRHGHHLPEASSPLQETFLLPAARAAGVTCSGRTSGAVPLHRRARGRPFDWGGGCRGDGSRLPSQRWRPSTVGGRRAGCQSASVPTGMRHQSGPVRRSAASTSASPSSRRTCTCTFISRTTSCSRAPRSWFAQLHSPRVRLRLSDEARGGRRLAGTSAST